MEADIEKLVSTKSFKDLTIQERNEWADLFSTEEEYEQMRSMFLGLETIKEEEFEPSAKVKRSLDDLFEQTHGMKAGVVKTSLWTRIFPQEKSFFQRPLVQMAAALVLVLLAIPFFTQNSFKNDVVQMAKEDSFGAKKNSTTTEMPVAELNSEGSISKNSAASGALDESPLVADAEMVMAEAEDMSEDQVMSAPVPSIAHSDLDFERQENSGYAAAAAVKSTSVAEQKGVLDLLIVTF
ncbi:MAG: hypothetical protein V4638_04375 [Bacteroidota bacterium]